VIQLGWVETRSVIHDRHVQAVSLDARLHQDVTVGRRVLRRILEQVRERRRREARIDFDRQIRIRIHAHGSPLKRVLHESDGRIHHVVGFDPLAIDGDCGRVDACHIQDVLEETS
jgi:hypothetical protein